MCDVDKNDENSIYLNKFDELVKMQLKRIEMLKKNSSFVDFSKLDEIVIGFCGGDGIGPLIVDEAMKILEVVLNDELKVGRVRFKKIEGLTIENRVKLANTLPDEVLSEIKGCNVFLKGPTTTPKRGDGLLPLESANVALRRELDLFANVRPIKIESEGIDWVFFRENTEGAYALGSCGLNIGPNLAVDFTVTTKPATFRIAKMAFDFARANGRRRLTIVTKANILKTTDGNFLAYCKEVAKDYPEIEVDDIFIDIATAKLIDKAERHRFSVFLLPNLYGDIITDEAAQIQGGVGTAGSANIGTKHAMFEAVHGSAPQMFTQKRQQYADPSSIIRAAAMMLGHVGFVKKAERLNKALDFCMFDEKKIKVTGFSDGATTKEFGAYVLEAFLSKF